VTDQSVRWPARLWLVRHGQSAGNVARDRARAAGRARIDLDIRDADVPLSVLGQQQAEALAAWFAALPERERPEVVLVSPYLRARQTAQAILDALPGGPNLLCADERLREREFGILDRLTTSGIGEHFPDQAEARALLGKFYHRPPGGESWCDVILRLRSALDTLSLHHRGKRVLIVGHQVVVLCLRYLLEKLDEAQILAIDAKGDVANCGVTEYGLAPGAGELELMRYNFVAPLLTVGTPVTTEPDAAVAVR
jgi:broad specificity phosphatase PhoE